VASAGPLLGQMASHAPSRDAVVGVSPAYALHARPRLFAALAAALDVEFAPLEEASAAAAIVEVGAHSGSGDDARVSHAAVPVATFADGLGERRVAREVRLTCADALDARLRGLMLSPQLAGAGLGPISRTETVLAEDREGARWAVARDGGGRQRISAELPELGTDEVLADALLSGRGMAVVALVHFLRAAGAARESTAPLRATIVFDDPNLRWRSYGFIDYPRLVEHADAHGYHAAMAMVPLDAVGAHGATVALFRRRTDRLSLAFHGNSHVRNELLVLDDRAGALALCAQALRRVRRWEARTGLHVDRLMIPPHGMCSASVAEALAAVGFDALCALHAEPWSERPRPDKLLAGWGPATFVGPTAVIQRMPLCCSRAELALRAFMGRPIVLYGHHQDLAGGFDLLEQAAATVNGLGEVEWTSLEGLARTNITTGLDGDLATARPYAGRVRLRVPGRARRLVVTEPRYSDGTLAGWSASPEPITPFGEAIACEGGTEMEIRLRPRDEIDPATLARPGRRPWPLIRRAATEARDRAMPLPGVRLLR
jgi:hypothetical protein